MEVIFYSFILLLSLSWKVVVIKTDEARLIQLLHSQIILIVH